MNTLINTPGMAISEVDSQVGQAGHVGCPVLLIILSADEKGLYVYVSENLNVQIILNTIIRLLQDLLPE